MNVLRISFVVLPTWPFDDLLESLDVVFTFFDAKIFLRQAESFALIFPFVLLEILVTLVF
jgi:hypothetical protein